MCTFSLTQRHPRSKRIQVIVLHAFFWASETIGTSRVSKEEENQLIFDRAFGVFLIACLFCLLGLLRVFLSMSFLLYFACALDLLRSLSVFHTVLFMFMFSCGHSTYPWSSRTENPLVRKVPSHVGAKHQLD